MLALMPSSPRLRRRSAPRNDTAFLVIASEAKQSRRNIHAVILAVVAWRVRESSKLGAPRPPSRWLDVEADTRDRHQEILEILRWLGPGELAIGNNHDSILAMPGHHLRSVMQRSVDDLAESGLGILKLPSVHRRPLARAGAHAVISEIASSLRSSQ